MGHLGIRATAKALFQKSDQEIKIQTLPLDRPTTKRRSSGHGLDGWPMAEGTKLTGQTETESLKRRREASSVAPRRFKITRARLNTLARHRDEK